MLVSKWLMSDRYTAYPGGCAAEGIFRPNTSSPSGTMTPLPSAMW